MFVVEQVSLCLAWSETPEDTLSHGVAHIVYVEIVPRNCILFA